jgi:hypothetical protein
VALLTLGRSGDGFGSPGARSFWVASFLKDFVVVKDLVSHRVENPSQQQKFT